MTVFVLAFWPLRQLRLLRTFTLCCVRCVRWKLCFTFAVILQPINARTVKRRNWTELN